MKWGGGGQGAPKSCFQCWGKEPSREPWGLFRLQEHLGHTTAAHRPWSFIAWGVCDSLLNIAIPSVKSHQWLQKEKAQGWRWALHKIPCVTTLMDHFQKPFKEALGLPGAWLLACLPRQVLQLPGNKVPPGLDGYWHPLWEPFGLCFCKLAWLQHKHPRGLNPTGIRQRFMIWPRK